MSDTRYVRGFTGKENVPERDRARYDRRLSEAEIIGTCPVDGCERELSRKETETRQHELNHLEGKTKRVAGVWLRLTDEQKTAMAEFVARG